MHYRGVDEHGVIHYVDKQWSPLTKKQVFAPWCGVQRDWPELWRREGIAQARPRNQAVTCLFCLYLRAGARSGKPV